MRDRDYRQLHAVLDDAMDEIASQGLRWKDVAEASGLCYATVRNIALDRTRRPQFRTVERLISSLGMRISVLRVRRARTA